MEKGFYIVRQVNYLGEVSNKKTIGYYEGEIHKDGSKNTYPWEIVGCDEIIANKGIEVLKKIDMDVIE